MIFSDLLLVWIENKSNMVVGGVDQQRLNTIDVVFSENSKSFSFPVDWDGRWAGLPLWSTLLILTLNPI